MTTPTELSEADKEIEKCVEAVCFGRLGDYSTSTGGEIRQFCFEVGLLVQKETQRLLREKMEGEDEYVAKIIHYPECWDTCAYPTLTLALWEISGIDATKNKCTTCESRLAQQEKR